MCRAPIQSQASSSAFYHHSLVLYFYQFRKCCNSMSKIGPHQTLLLNGNNHIIDVNGTAATVLEKARRAFEQGRTLPLTFRKSQLRNLQKCMLEHESRFVDALYTDLKKPKLECLCYEVRGVVEDINKILHHLDEWAKPETPAKPMANNFDGVFIYNDPFGVVLIMGAWNYPIQLTLVPLLGAIAAGNCVVLKPSDVSIATSQLLFELLPKYLDPECYPVFLGGVEETTELLTHKFDYIFYTGSTAVGKIVQLAAAKHLTPTTLELGGKSPVYIDNSVDFEKSVRRILWAKCMNSGQTCVAPDYVLCTREVQDKFVEVARRVLREFFGDEIQKSQDFGRIIADRHFDRLIKLISGLDVAIGGRYDRQDRFMEPTIVTNVDPNHPIMQEEIFGPILPIILVQGLDDAVEFINARDKPLALYIFSSRKKDVESVLQRTSSGGVCVNDVLLQITVDCLPFGGVGNSGMGAYHGKASFDTFTHKKSVLAKNFNGLFERILAARYPPYTESKIKIMLRGAQAWKPFRIRGFFYILAFFLGVSSTVVGYYIYKIVQNK